MDVVWVRDESVVVWDGSEMELLQDDSDVGVEQVWNEYGI